MGSSVVFQQLQVLRDYAKDSERVVRESCEVALDMVDYENSGDFQYATVN